MKKKTYSAKQQSAISLLNTLRQLLLPTGHQLTMNHWRLAVMVDQQLGIKCQQLAGTATGGPTLSTTNKRKPPWICKTITHRANVSGLPYSPHG